MNFVDIFTPMTTAVFMFLAVIFASVGLFGLPEQMLNPRGLSKKAQEKRDGGYRISKNPDSKSSLGSLSKYAANFAPDRAGNDSARVKEMIVKSGNPYNVGTVQEFTGVRILIAVVGGAFGLIAWFMFGLNPLFALVFAIVGWVLPWQELKSKTKARAQAVRRELPEMLDLLAVAMNAGMTLPRAMVVVAKQSPDSTIKPDIQVLASEIKASRPISESLRDLYHKYDSPIMESFCKSLIKSEETGAEVSDILESQSESTRTDYESLVIEKVNKLPTKMIIPTTGILFPSFMATMMFPSLVSMMEFM